MNLELGNLARHLKDGLKPIYLIHGDEIQLQQEAADALRQTARQQGFSERELYHVDRYADWAELLASANTLSLFGDRKILELRFTGKVDTNAANALEKYAADPSPDTLLILFLPKLDATATKAKWFNACNQSGVTLKLPDINTPDAFRQWLQHRLQQAGLSTSAEAFQLLADRLEGNLLAAQQEIVKLRLLSDSNTVSLEQVQQYVSDSARYDTTDLANSILEGNVARAVRVLSSLRAEGESTSSVLWIIARDARALAATREGMDSGQPISSLLQANGVWSSRQRSFQQALSRISSPAARLLVKESLAIDMAIKGQSKEEPWDVLLRLVYLMATGHPLLRSPA